MPQQCRLPEKPSLEQLRNQARELQRSVEAGDSEALALLEEMHPRRGGALRDKKLKLADAHLATARLYGFSSWRRMTEIVEEIAKWTCSPHTHLVGGAMTTEKDRHDEFLRLACLNYGNDHPSRWAQAQEMLAQHPEIAGGSLHAAAAAGDGDGVADWVAKRSLGGRATATGGPYQWEPLLYLCYSRLDDRQGGVGFMRAATALLDAGADPNAGYLWDGLPSPFTALTGAFGEGEDRDNQPPHQIAMQLATLLLSRGADPNDSQVLYNRTWSTTDEHLELLVAVRPRLGEGDGGPWHRRLREAHPTPQEMVDEELVKAAAMGRANRVRLMLEIGGNPAARGAHPIHDGRSGYELAVSNGHAEIVEMLEASGAHGPHPHRD